MLWRFSSRFNIYCPHGLSTECLIIYFLFYELYFFITALATLYCIYTPPAHFGIFPLYYFPYFHCSSSQLTFCDLGKDSYHFAFSPHPPCAKVVLRILGGDVIHPVTLTNADFMAPTFSSPYFCRDSWFIFHHPYDNIPWDTHISTA